MGSTPAQAQDHLAPVLITSEHALPHKPLRRGPDRRDTGLPTLSKTFGKHEDATRWAQTVEGRLAVGNVLDLMRPGGRL
jgi:hypothetical protein